MIHFPSLSHIKNRHPAFLARLEYELNCMRKYDDPMGVKPSKYPKKGERMKDYARKYKVTVEDMKRILPSVERYLGG